MRNVTDRQQKRDPWTDPDPQPEDFEEWFADPENEWVSVKIPPNSGFIFPIPDGVTGEEWARRKAAAHARREKLPEEIAFENGWISAAQLRELAKPYLKTQYGKYLARVADEAEA